MRVSKRRITVTIKGTPDEGGFLRLSEFIRELEAIRVALTHTERIVTGDDDPDVYFRIVSLSMSSPAQVVLEETAVRTEDGKRKPLPRVPIAERMVSTLRQIDLRGRVPAKVKDLAALEAYKSVGAATQKHIEEVRIDGAQHSVSINREFHKKIDKIIGPDEFLQGSLKGLLLAIKLHKTTRFEIYPVIGPSKVACHFSAHLKPRVFEAIEQNVRVIGTLRYKNWAPYPHAINVDDLEVYPPDDELPTLSSLKGLAKHDDAAPPDA